MTLGELIIEDRGKITGQRVLNVDDGPTIESSFSMEGKCKGIIGTDIGTYWSLLRPDEVCTRIPCVCSRINIQALREVYPR